MDGDEGLALYRTRFDSNQPFTLVITDLELPKKGGLGVISEIRSISKSQPILILSAHDDADFMAEAISLEVQGYLLKPLSMPKFFQHLEKILLEPSPLIYTEKKDPVTQWKLLPELEEFLKNPLHKPIALLRIRVNYLTNIYDLVGEEYADEYVSELGALLESLQINSEGTFYRCDIDEFCLVLKNQDLQYANALANDMVSIARYFHTSEKGIILNSTLSIGIAYGTENLLVNSRLALDNFVESDNTTGVTVFIQSDEERDRARNNGREILKMIYQALEEENIVPYVQPIVSAENGDTEIFNSFVRIRQDEKIYGPETFLNVAINTHQMTMITRSMIRNTLGLHSKIQPKNAILTICLADEDVSDEALLTYIQFWTERYRLNPSNIAFELVGREKESMSNSQFSLVKGLKAQGYKIILNRFGSGEFNLAYLFELKPDYIKIHPDLIMQLHSEPKAIMIVQKLADIIHLVGAKAIATHLSTVDDVELLKSIDIDYLQGYAVAAPYEVL